MARRDVQRSDYFNEQAHRLYPVGGSATGRPSFERFEAGPLRAVEELFARRFEDQPEAAVGIRIAITHAVPFFPAMVFYACLVGDHVELLDLVVDEDYWSLIGDDPPS